MACHSGKITIGHSKIQWEAGRWSKKPCYDIPFVVFFIFFTISISIYIAICFCFYFFFSGGHGDGQRRWRVGIYVCICTDSIQSLFLEIIKKMRTLGGWGDNERGDWPWHWNGNEKNYLCIWFLQHGGELKVECFSTLSISIGAIIVIVVWRKERGVFLCSVFPNQMLHVFSHPYAGAGRGMVMWGMKWGTIDSACEAFVQNVPAQPRVQTSYCVLRHGIHVAPHIQMQLHCLYRDRTQFQF